VTWHSFKPVNSPFDRTVLIDMLYITMGTMYSVRSRPTRTSYFLTTLRLRTLYMEHDMGFASDEVSWSQVPQPHDSTITSNIKFGWLGCIFWGGAPFAQPVLTGTLCILSKRIKLSNLDMLFYNDIATWETVYGTRHGFCIRWWLMANRNIFQKICYS